MEPAGRRHRPPIRYSLLLLLDYVESLERLAVLEHLYDVHALTTLNSYVHCLAGISTEVVALEHCTCCAYDVDSVEAALREAEVYALYERIRINREACCVLNVVDCVNTCDNKYVLKCLLRLAPEVGELNACLILARTSEFYDSCLVVLRRDATAVELPCV